MTPLRAYRFHGRVKRDGTAARRFGPIAIRVERGRRVEGPRGDPGRADLSALFGVYRRKTYETVLDVINGDKRGVRCTVERVSEWVRSSDNSGRTGRGRGRTRLLATERTGATARRDNDRTVGRDASGRVRRSQDGRAACASATGVGGPVAVGRRAAVLRLSAAAVDADRCGVPPAGSSATAAAAAAASGRSPSGDGRRGRGRSGRRLPVQRVRKRATAGDRPGRGPFSARTNATDPYLYGTRFTGVGRDRVNICPPLVDDVAFSGPSSPGVRPRVGAGF